MLSKQQFNQLKSAKTAAVQAYKKRKFEASSVLNTVHEVKDNKLNVINISDTEGGSRIWFQNKSANGSNLDIEKDENSDKNENEEKRNQKEEESKTQETVSLDIPKLKIKQNK